ncbi:MAG: enoyl-CoA hydratase [Acidimicrobiales bacterium]|nr:enoyl-CoA hydratase [Acidimicrobiales bacterium]RZV48168.1 MAG: enoyl-CoA hydratase [Acidimicrobiales bacterium]
MQNRKVDTHLDDRGVFTITLNDPEKRNALSAALTAELVAAMDEADTNDAVRVVVITNTGHVFCAGADLSERTSDDRQTDLVDPLTIFSRIQSSPKPWVGRIAGHAVAGGTGLAAALDISVARDDAKFGFTEVRIGVAPAIISVICLPKMRRGEATQVFLRGQRFDGTEAARLGLITKAVTADEIDAEVAAVVDDLLLGGPKALAAAKDVISRVSELPASEAFSWAAARSAELFQSEEAAEGMRAYLEKRPPRWAPKAD